MFKHYDWGSQIEPKRMLMFPQMGHLKKML